MADNRLARLAPSGMGTTATAVRTAAFIVAALAIFAVPIAFIFAASGQTSYRLALEILAAAIVLVVFAAVAVRPFDPLRG